MVRQKVAKAEVQEEKKEEATGEMTEEATGATGAVAVVHAETEVVADKNYVIPRVAREQHKQQLEIFKALYVTA